jgi:histidinol-phosphate aminotransferase
MALLLDVLREHSLEPAGPAVANFAFVRISDAESLNDALLRRGVIVRPLRSFGAPDALRITAGTPDEVAFLCDALDALAAPVVSSLV